MLTDYRALNQCTYVAMSYYLLDREQGDLAALYQFKGDFNKGSRWLLVFCYIGDGSFLQAIKENFTLSPAIKWLKLHALHANERETIKIYYCDIDVVREKKYKIFGNKLQAQHFKIFLLMSQMDTVSGYQKALTQIKFP